MTLDLPEAPNPSAIVRSVVNPIAQPIVLPTRHAADPAPITSPVVEPTPEPAPCSTTTTLEVKQSELDQTPELQLIRDLLEAYRLQLTASLAQQDAAEELEESKAKYENASQANNDRKEIVADLLKSLPERLLAITDPASAAVVAQIKESQTQTPKPESGGDSWKAWLAIPTQQLVDLGVEGLGEKKAEMLIARFPTISELETARTGAIAKREHFSKQLVKGIGPKTADSIETLMISLQKTGIEQVKESRAIKKPIPAKADTLDSAIANDDDWSNPHDDTDQMYADVEGDGDIDPSPAEDSETWFDEYHRILVSDREQIATAWGVNLTNKPAEWTEGFMAFESWPVDGCIYDATDSNPRTLEKAKRWVQGWTAAHMREMQL